MNTELFLWLNGLAGRSHIADAVVAFCADWLCYVVLAAMLIAVLMDRRKFMRPMAVAFASATVARVIFATAIQMLWPVSRPYAVLSNVTQLVSASGRAFPSGHATFFFALAASLWLYNPRWGIAGLIAALLCGIARVISGVHWPADILGGAIVGTAVAVLVNFILQKRRLTSV